MSDTSLPFINVGLLVLVLVLARAAGAESIAFAQEPGVSERKTRAIWIRPRRRL